MPGNHPTPRPPAGSAKRVLGMLLCMLMLVQLAAAGTVIDEVYTHNQDTSETGAVSSTSSGGSATYFDRIKLTEIETRQGLAFISIDVQKTPSIGIYSYLAEGDYDITYTMDGVTKPARLYVQPVTDILGQITSIRFTIFFDDWDISGKSGTKTIVLSEQLVRIGTRDATHNAPAELMSATGKYTQNAYKYSIASWIAWENHLIVTDDIDNTYQVDLSRGDVIRHYSQIDVMKNNAIYLSDAGNDDFSGTFIKTEIDKIRIYDPTGFSYTADLTGGGADISSAATIYIQNAQTGALLADAQLSILASAGGTEIEVINQTLPGGTATYTLQPTGGGAPNPDYYRAVATVPGFSQIIENHSFTLTGPHDVIIEMRPDAGGPTDPGKCYLEFYVRDLNANSIPFASVQCAGMIRQTNSKGYLVIEVAKNATYPYVVKKSGYVTIEGTATVADGPRYTVNVALGQGSVPTLTPTLGPGETPGATPTPDTRTNEQKGQAIIDLIADFAYPIAVIAIIATIYGLLGMMMPRRR